LQAAKALGTDSQILFDPEDLFERKNLGKIVDCLADVMELANGATSKASMDPLQQSHHHHIDAAPEHFSATTGEIHGSGSHVSFSASKSVRLVVRS
jgi:hypothetical protein